MKIWRRENTKLLKNLKTEKESDFVDISTSSTPKKQDNKKDKMEEIYSTKDKQVKYKRQTPIEAEEAAKRAQQAKEQLVQGEAEITLDEPENRENIVELTSDFEEGTVIADDIIEDVREFSKERNVHIEDINEIDVDLDSSDLLKKYERQQNATARHEERVKRNFENEFERLFGKPKYDVHSEKIVAKIPTYQHDSKVNLINLKAGRFTDVLESEYDEYLKAINPTLAKKKSSKDSGAKKTHQPVTVKQKKNTEEPKKEKKRLLPKKVRKFFRIMYLILFPKHPVNAYESDKKSAPIQRTPDSKQVEAQIKSNHKHLVLRCVLLSVLFVLTTTLAVMQKISGAQLFSGIPHSALIFCLINLFALLVCGFVGWPYIVNGFKPLRQFKGNADTAVSCAFVACILEQIAAFFAVDKFVDSTLHLYAPIVTLSFMLNILGRIFMVNRVKNNFDFINLKGPDRVVEIYNDPDTSRKMLSGTTASRSLIAYQHKTNHLSDFLKISYAPDPSEELSSKLAPITIVCSVFVAIVYGILSKTIIGAFSALAVMCCISISMCSLIAGNLHLMLTGKDNIRHNAMISGYPSVKQFSDSDAVIVNAFDLYPKGSIKLNGIKNFVDYRIDESLLSAALVLKAARSPLYHVFDDVLKKNKHSRMRVESVLYEDKLGLVGWINGERILVGSRELLDRFHIFIDDASEETRHISKGKNVTYIACAGQLVSMLVTTYKSDPSVRKELLSAHACGLCLLVSTTDNNITADKIAADYEIYYRTIKVLSSGYSTTCNELSENTEENARAYVATTGDFRSFIHAVTSCIAFKQNFTIAMIVQIFGLIMGVLLCATIVLYNSVAILGVIEVMLYMLFWSIATVAVQFIKRH